MKIPWSLPLHRSLTTGEKSPWPEITRPCQGLQPRPSLPAWGRCAQSPRRVPTDTWWNKPRGFRRISRDLHGS